MKTAIAKEWVKMLRSKKYKQGKGALKFKYRGQMRHCCLGVLCELYQKTHKKKLPVTTDIDGTDMPEGAKHYQFAEEYQVLPEAVRKWSGISDEEGRFVTGNDDDCFTLTTLNDHGASFKTIANKIEKHAATL